MTRGRYALLAGLLGMLPMFLPLAIDASLPLMPALARHYGTGAAAVQLSLSALVLGLAAGQLVYGPLSDRFGRKPVILGGIGLFTATALACTQAPSIEFLTVLRFLQGFFACSGIIVARAIIRDVFDREAGARLFALMMGIHGIMPAVSPWLGGWITETFGWQAVFGFMAAFGVVAVVAVAAGLGETNRTRSADALRPATLLRNYALILRDRTFRANATCASFLYAALFAYFAGAPVGIMQALDLTPSRFGIVMAAPMIAYIVTQITAARVVRAAGLGRMIRIGTSLAATAGIGMTALVLAGIVSLYSLMIPVVLMLASIAFVTPGTTVGALSPFAQMAGTASSLLGFIQFGAGAAATSVVALLDDGTPLPMAGAIAVFTTASLVAWLVLVRPLHRAAPA